MRPFSFSAVGSPAGLPTCLHDNRIQPVSDTQHNLPTAAHRIANLAIQAAGCAQEVDAG